MGIGTVLADDPMFNCCIEGGRNPIRIICDIIKDYLDQDRKNGKGYSYHYCLLYSDELQKPYKEAGYKILLTEKKMGHIDLQHLMEARKREDRQYPVRRAAVILIMAALEDCPENTGSIAPSCFWGNNGQDSGAKEEWKKPDQLFSQT